MVTIRALIHCKGADLIKYWRFFLMILFIYFLVRGREGEREGEKHQCVIAYHTPPTGDLVYNPGMCPAWELNW